MTTRLSKTQATSRIVQLSRRLANVCRVTFHARSGPGSRCGWSGTGQGQVIAAYDADASLTFTEAGHFQLAPTPERPTPPSVPFRNVFRWRLQEEGLALSHERRGPAAAVWLFDLVADPFRETEFLSRKAHLCGDDRYRARLSLVEQGVDLVWHIQGPGKNERLCYRYRFPAEAGE
jgi:hypothetical protein